jgi:phage major head subunit gpT-like protein
MYGVYAPMMEQMGRAAKVHPDQMLFYLLANGFTIDCYDGQPFFDADHPGFGPDGVPISVSNLQPAEGTAGPAWFLLDTKQPVKPLVWQTRIPYNFTTIMKDTDRGVFLRDEYLFGIRARVNAGFGFWQCAYGSVQPLTAANFALARAAMATLRGDQGQILGIEANTLVCGPSNEAAARLLLKATSVEATSNIWHESADLIVTPYLQ